MRLVYTMFINNNRASFHLWKKGNLVQHQKVSEYYDYGYNTKLEGWFYTQNRPRPEGNFQ